MSNKSILNKKPIIVPEKVMLIVVDSFCGAGGMTQGVEQAVDGQGNRLAVVVAGVNHDKMAIESHAANHPETTHFVEDVRDKKLPRRIQAVVRQARKLYPNAKVLFHASLECTNFSNAKGGKSRDADSRSLAEFMPNYLTVLKPDVFTVENVREFLAWGPMVAKPNMKHEFEGHPAPVCEMAFDKKKGIWDYHWIPESRTKGQSHFRWRQGIEAMGYRYEHKLHNTADFGANTSRTRYFAQFVRDGLPIAWPDPTHAKNPQKATLFGKELARWRPIRECLELEDKGRSIFRDKALSDKTYERIFEGLVRHVGNGDRSFISKYFTGHGMHSSLDAPAATVKTVDNQALITTEPFMARLFATASNNHGTYPTDQPATTITTADGHAVVTPEPFAMNYHSGSPALRCKSMDDPAQTLTTENRLALVSPEAFCMKYHGSGDNTFSTGQPCSTLTTTDRVGIVQTEQFISLYYSEGKQNDSIESPAACITTNPHHRLMSAQFIDQQYGKSVPASIDDAAGCLTVNPKLALVEAFIADPQWGGHSHSIDQPGHTIIARQDKAPASLVSPEFITQRNEGTDGRNSSLEQPAKTVTTTGGNMELVSAEWLLNNQHQNAGSSLDEPCPTLMTGNHHYVMTTNFTNVGTDLDSPSPTLTADRHWAYLMTAEQGIQPVIIVYPTDTFWQRQIKAFMAEYGIVDILMRMLKVRELKLIQGFPEEYVLLGSQTQAKKFIGNSVPPKYPKAWMQAIGLAMRKEVTNG